MRSEVFLLTFLKKVCNNQKRDISLLQKLKKILHMTYFICYNAKYIASRKSLKAAIDFIDAKGIHDDEDNELYIVDQQGNNYSPNGDIMEWV